MIKKDVEYGDNNSFPLFGRKEYLSCKSIDFGWFIKDGLCLPFYVKKKLFFTYMVFSHEIITLSHGHREMTKIDFLNEVIKEIKEKRGDIDFIIQPDTNVLFKEFPKGSVFCEFGSFRVDLRLSEDELFSNIHTKHRNVIRKAIKSNVIIEKGNEFKNKALSLVQDTMKRQSLNYISSSDFDIEFDAIGENVEFYVAIKDSEIQGSAIIYWDRNHAYYIHGGSVCSPCSGALNLMHWCIIKDMKLRGVDKYDFVGARLKPKSGSKLEGIQRFKSRFGSALEVGYLWKFPIKPFKYKLFLLLVKFKSLIKGKKYLGDIIDQEIEIKSKNYL